MSYLISRLREPSTWSGLAVLFALFGVPATTIGLVQQVVGGVLGLAAILVPEKGTTAPKVDAAPLPAPAPVPPPSSGVGIGPFSSGG